MDSHCSWISGSRRSTRDFPFAVFIEAAILRNVLRRIAGSKATVEVLPGDGRYPAQRWRTAGRLRLVNDKVIVITGAASGIGAAVARRAGQRGASLVLAARRDAERREVAPGSGPRR